MIQTMKRSDNNPFMEKNITELNSKRKAPEIINIDDDDENDKDYRPTKQQRKNVPLINERKDIKRALSDSIKEESVKRRKLLEVQDYELKEKIKKEKDNIIKKEKTRTRSS